MTRDGKRVVVEGDSEDRISDLPRNIIDHIPELLPIQDAARTSILSRNWRYIWATLPNLVLDYHFCRELTEKSQSNFKEAVDESYLPLFGNGNLCAYHIVLFHQGPLLSNLTLDLCHGTQYLNIISPGLKSSYVRDSHYNPFLNCFMICKDLREFELEFDDVFNNSKHDEKSTLDKLIDSLPALEVLHLDSFFVELLSANIVPNGLPFMLNCLRHLSIGVDFGKMGQISGALQLIKSSPNLSKLDIWVRLASGNAEAVLENLNAPACLERPLDKLKYVAIDGFESSEAELLFVKLLLSHTPSLISMCIDQYTEITVDVALELKHFHRASPRAKLFY